ncbi:MAG TPA: hypothetical protein VK866_17700, partial [Acidimicrobiales bacterium]|nr:hypothetical protein [Acidimicrobiales bacterium]
VEQAVPFPASLPTPGSLGARLASPSRLSFTIPRAAVASGIPYTAEGLLDWRAWTIRVPVGARQADGERPPLLPGSNPNILNQPYRPQAPGPGDTSIEAPWWLQISPNPRAGFVAATRPVEHLGRTELWHTRLAVRDATLVDGQQALGPLSEAPSPDRAIRVVWSPDPDLPSLVGNVGGANTGSPPEPFLSAMTQRDRVSLIRLTTDSLLAGGDRTPVPVDTLHLSALGATLDLGATFPDPAPNANIGLKQWRHRATFGRDQYVRVVNRGYLLPFGHPCVEITITERRFVGSGPSRSAPLERRTFLVVTQPVVDYDGRDGELMPTEGRQVPFRRVRMRTIVSPPFNKDPLPGSGTTTTNCYFPVDAVTGRDVEFLATAVDPDGRSVDVRMPMAFVFGPLADQIGAMATIRAAWNAYDHPERRWARVDGQKVAYAPSLPQRRGATSVTTRRVRFDLTDQADPTLDPVPGRRRSFPAMEVAEVQLEEVEALSANSLDGTRIRFDGVYVASGFAAPVNAGGLWAELVDPQPLRFSRPPAQATTPGAGTDRAGGVITPDLQIRGLSRSIGVSGGNPADLRGGQFSPASFFAGAAPRLLGGISLLDVIVPVAIPAGEVGPDSALAISSRRTADAVEALIRWRPDLKSDPLGVFEPGRLRLDATVVTPLDPTDGAPTSRVDGELTDFALNVPTKSAMLIRIELSRLSFTSRNGQTPSVDAQVRNVSFGGELAWIEGLRKYLSFGGAGGPEISVLPDRIEAVVGVTLPNITLGVFALRNIRFLAGLDLPLTGEPARVRFGLSTRDDPFRLTVFCIGGGGWVGLAFGADGLERLELGFEGGAEIAIDLGVASGSVSIMFSIALLLVQGDGGEQAELIGMFRLQGSVSAGPVSASLTLGLQLGYRTRSKSGGGTLKEMYGKGTIELDLSVPLVPTPPISITYERSFRSDLADPTFEDQLTTDDWGAYCGAFAGA